MAHLNVKWRMDHKWWKAHFITMVTSSACSTVVLGLRVSDGLNGCKVNTASAETRCCSLTGLLEWLVGDGIAKTNCRQTMETYYYWSVCVCGFRAALSLSLSVFLMVLEKVPSCDQERQSALDDARQNPREAIFIPDCGHGGLYKAVQCHQSTGYCWCVLVDTGRPIPGTSTR